MPSQLAPEQLRCEGVVSGGVGVVVLATSVLARQDVEGEGGKFGFGLRGNRLMGAIGAGDEQQNLAGLIEGEFEWRL